VPTSRIGGKKIIFFLNQSLARFLHFQFPCQFSKKFESNFMDYFIQYFGFNFMDYFIQYFGFNNSIFWIQFFGFFHSIFWIQFFGFFKTKILNGHASRKTS